MHDIVNNIAVTQSVMPQTITSTALTTGTVDTQGADIQSFVVLVGNINDTLSGTVRIDLSISHADDDGTGNPTAFTACDDTGVLNFSGLVNGVFASVNASAAAEKRYVIDYVGGLRFVKVTATPVGLTNGGPVALLSLQANLHTLPAVNV
ncbi:MAG: hypothetical protein KGQ70_03740 [Alphaproteobacteria bacterium]|nr:hypothetical protein [Alphaproteobacteria bacterium]